MSQMIRCDNCEKTLDCMAEECKSWIHNGEYKLDFCSQKCAEEWYANNPKEE